MNRPKAAADMLKNLLRYAYDELDLYFSPDLERECESIIDLVIDQAVIEARNERKGLANQKRDYG